jgi:hypothetical protein
MDKKMLIIGAGIIIALGIIIIILGNNPSSDTDVKNGNVTKVYQCSDSVDNDQDKLIDEKDPGCHSDGNANNFDSYDPEDDDENNKIEETLGDFFSGKMGNNLECEATYKVADDNELKTIMYISGKRIRLNYDMKIPVPGEGGKTQKNLYMISDGEYGYVWGDSFLGEVMQGFKIKMDKMGSGQEAPAGTEMIDYEMPVTHCKPWIVDEKMFEIPDGIEFIDPNNITIEDMVPAGSGNMDIDCSLCHQLPADQIADCLSSLGCE